MRPAEPPPPLSPEEVTRRIDARMAAWVKSGRPVPGSAITNTQAHRMLAAGLVTRSELRAAGLPW